MSFYHFPSLENHNGSWHIEQLCTASWGWLGTVSGCRVMMLGAPGRCACNLNSLVPGRSECDSKNVIFNLILLIGIFRSFHDNAFQLMPKDLTDDRSRSCGIKCKEAPVAHQCGTHVKAFTAPGWRAVGWGRSPDAQQHPCQTLDYWQLTH